MYEVFINDRSLKLSKNQADLDGNFLSYEAGFSWEEKLKCLREGTLSSLSVYAADVEAAWQDFNTHFDLIEAGGGVVRKNGETLFIFRNGKWDLPKGKWEEGESMEACAVREVEEECGLGKLSIVHKLPNSYHTYSIGDREILKLTHWYLMSSSDESELIPQLEEGIEKVEWKDEQAVKEALKNTYPNIIKVMESC